MDNYSKTVYNSDHSMSWSEKIFTGAANYYGLDNFFQF